MRTRSPLLLALVLLIATALNWAWVPSGPAVVVVAQSPPPSTVIFSPLLNFTLPVQLELGDVVAPHLYDWNFSSAGPYIIVPHKSVLNVASGNKITIAMRARFVGWQSGYSVGIPIDKRTEGTANYNWEFDSSTMYMRIHANDNVYDVSVSHTLNTWNFYTMVLNGTQLRGYLNGALKAQRSSVPQTSGNTVNLYIGSSNAATYKIIGAISMVAIYSRALLGAEIQQIYNSSVVAGSELAMFLDATFYNGTRYLDLSGNGNHGTPHGSLLRVPSNQTWLWVVKGLTSDSVVRFRFFPNGTIIVFSDGSTAAISGPVNGAGLVEDFAVGRTDIAYVLVPSPTAQTSEATLVATPAHAHMPSRIELGASWLVGVSNIIAIFQNGNLMWANGTGASSTGPVLVTSVRAIPGAWVNITYVPLSGFVGGQTALIACTISGCWSTYFNVSYVQGYSLSLSVQQRTTVGTTPWYNITTNYTGTVELHNLNAYLNLTVPPLQPGDVLAPHLYDWHFDGGSGTRIEVAFFNESRTELTVELSYMLLRVAPGWDPVFARANEHNYGWRLYQSFNTTYVDFAYQNATGAKFWPVNTGPRNLDTWYDLSVSFSVSNQRIAMVLDGAVVMTSVDAYEIGGNPQPVRIGGQYWLGRVGYARIYNRALSVEEIATAQTTRIVNAAQLAMFLDATFFNGTHYLDLSGSGNHGAPYGGVSRVPANRTWVWAIRGLSTAPVVWLRFFPNGTIIVFSDGSAAVISGPVNGVGLVEEFAVGRTDIAYVLVPSPTRWGERYALTMSTVGTLGFVAWMNVSALYPLQTATVVYDKLLITSFSAGIPNGSRVDMNRAIDVCVNLAHAYDGQPVTNGAVAVAGRQATFNGTCWAVSISPLGSPVGSRSYALISGATSDLNVSYVDPSPVLAYVHDALAAGVTDIDYINQTAVITLQYASDSSPVPSGRVGILHDSWPLLVNVSNGAVVLNLTLLPANVTKSPLVYGVSDNGFVSTPYVNASLPFYRFQGEWWSTRSPHPWFTVSATVLNNTRAVTIRSNITTYTWLPAVPGYVYAVGGYTLIRGSAYVVATGDAVIILDKEIAQARIVPSIAPGTGDAYIGLSSNLTHPMGSNYVLYVRVNSTGAYVGARVGSAVVEGLAASGAMPPMVVSYAYSYDHLKNTTQWCMLLVYYVGTTSNYAHKCAFVPGAPPINLYPFIASESWIVVDRFAATAGQAILSIAAEDIGLTISGPYPATAIVRYVVVDKPTVVELNYGSVRIYYGGSRGLTFRGFVGYKLNLAVGGVTVSNYLIPSNNHTLELPLGFASFIIVDPTYASVTIVSAGLIQEPTETEYSVPVSPIVFPPPGLIVDTRLPQTSVVVVLAVALASAVGVSVFRSTRRLGASLSVAGATVSFVGVVLGGSGIVTANIALSLIASGVMAGAVALAISVSRD